MTKARRIALLLNANPAFNRDIMAGIAAYFGSMGAHWQLFVEEDFRLRLSGIEQWQRDGIRRTCERAIGKTASAHQRNCPLYCAFAAGGSRATPPLKHRLSITGNDIAGKRCSCKPPNLQAMSATVKIGGSAVVCRLSGEDEPDRVAWLDHFFALHDHATF